jgi:sec-independent protein translocase protein TatB
LIGPKELPELARTIGRFLNDLKRGTEGFKDEFFNMKDDAEYRKHIQAHSEEEKSNTNTQSQTQNQEIAPVDPESVIVNTSSVEQTTKATKVENNDGSNG